MASAGAGWRWIPGRSRFPWFLGLFGVFASIYVVALLSLLTVDPVVAGPDGRFPGFGYQPVAILVAAIPTILYARIVPVPASRLGVSPWGVAIDHGLRTSYLPWGRVALRDGRMYVSSRWKSFSSVFSLTGPQLDASVGMRGAAE